MIYLIKETFKIFFFGLCFVNTGVCVLLFEDFKVTFTLLGVSPHVMLILFMILNLSIYSIIWSYDFAEQIPDPKFLRYWFSGTVFFLKLVYLYFSIWLIQAYYTADYVVQTKLDYYFFDSEFVFLRNWSKQEFADQLNSLAELNHIIIPSNYQDEIINSVRTLATLTDRFVDFVKQAGYSTTNLIKTFPDPIHYMDFIAGSPTITILVFSLTTIFFIFFVSYVLALLAELEAIGYYDYDEDEDEYDETDKL